MGNRAVMAFGPDKPSTKGVYVHWNGGLCSIEGFLDAAKQLGINTPEQVADMIGLWMNSAIDVDKISRLDCDNWDNGLYILDEQLNIVGRKFTNSRPEEVNDAKRAAIRSEVVTLYRLRREPQ